MIMILQCMMAIQKMMEIGRENLPSKKEKNIMRFMGWVSYLCKQVYKGLEELQAKDQQIMSKELEH
jgi:hypothetical protein